MEKLTGNKHNHLFTDLIKVFIFGLMLLLPFLCFLPTGFYYGFNEHATNETTTEINYKYQSNEVNTLDDLVEGNIYELELEGLNIDDVMSVGDYYLFQLLTNLEIHYEDLILDQTLENVYKFTPNTILAIFRDNTISYIGTTYDYDDYLNSDYDIIYQYNASFNSNCIIKLLDFDSINYEFIHYTDYNVIESVETNVQDTISNKMYQAWQGVWQSPLFNWTNTTPLNTGLNGFISIFGINQSSYIANCLIYLLSITAIYVVFDIVLGIFKWLTHLINK